MVAILTVVLMTAAEISNLFSVVGVLVCFICMVIFILRLQGGDMFGASVVHVSQPVARVAYQKVHVPFSLQLCNSGEATYNDVQLKVHSDVSYYMRCFWGVPSTQLHSILAAPWPTFVTSLMSEKKENAVEEEQTVEETEEGQTVGEVEKMLEAEFTDEVVSGDFGETVKHLGLSSSHSPLTLGYSPRTVYPLVVCLLRQEEPEEGNDPSAVGALINIIHIKDTDCPMSTCVLHHYIKQYSGQLTKLQALYTQGSTGESRGTYGSGGSEQRNEQETEHRSGGSEQRNEQETEHGSGRSEQRNEEATEQNHEPRETQDEANNENEEQEEEEELIPLEEACVACQTKRITRALLPCRHVCICDTCFPRLDSCPMCRAAIRAYFLVAPETSEQDEEGGAEVEEAANPSVWQRIRNTMARLPRVDGQLLMGTFHIAVELNVRRFE